MTLEFKQNNSDVSLEEFAYSDWAYDTDDRKLMSGFTFKVFRLTVSWSSKIQATVAVSLSEAEITVLSKVAPSSRDIQLFD